MTAGTAGPSTPAGDDYISTLVSHFAAGNELWDREAGGIPRTVAKVEMICRIYFDPMDGQPDHRDYRMHHPSDARQWGRRGVPRTPAHQPDQDDLETSWEHRQRAAADHRPPYPTEANRAS